MWNIGKFLGVMICAAGVISAAIGAELTGTVPVNVTSATAADAKINAMNQARRQILNRVLAQYANPSQVQVAVQNAKSAELTNLIAASSIDGEQQSDTTYSANISMTIDEGAARAWLDSQNIQNRLGDFAGAADNAMILVSLSDKVANWIDLQRVARSVNVDLSTKYIMGNQATIELPAARQYGFVNALRAAGWRAENQNGIFRIWK